MKILGKPIAETILESLKKTIQTEKITPRLAVILANEEEISRTYIRYKRKAAEKIGIEVVTYEFNVLEHTAAMQKITQLNNDTKTDGIIIQLPLYTSWNPDVLINSVNPEKDVDGFVPNSPYTPATAAAVWEMLTEFARQEQYNTTETFLENKKIVIVGKGKTAGKPTRDLLKQKGYFIELIDSKTENPDEILKNADIIISATGKKNIINGANMKKNSYIIGIGVGKEIIDGKSYTYGDINEEEIQHKAKMYCPTIGGIGPLTIACLLRNVVQAAQKKTKNNHQNTPII